jgi:Flp pilus assembly protein TadG
MSRASSRRRRRAGSASLEFAFVVVPFLVLLVAAMDLARYFVTQQLLRTVTVAAARECMVLVTGGATDCNTIQAQVESIAPILNPGLLNISASSPLTDTKKKATTVTITSTYPFTFVLPFWAAESGVLSAETTLSF